MERNYLLTCFPAVRVDRQFRSALRANRRRHSNDEFPGRGQRPAATDQRSTGLGYGTGRRTDRMDQRTYNSEYALTVHRFL